MAGDTERKQLGSGSGQLLLHALTRLRFCHEENTATTSSAADLGSESTVLAGDGDKAVNERRGDGGRVGATQFPFIAQEPTGFIPVRGSNGGMHGASDFADSLEIAKYAAVTVNVALEHLPVIDSALARSPSVGEDKAPINLISIAGDLLTMNAIYIQVHGADTAVERGIVILTASRDTDELSFDVLHNFPNLLAGELPSGKARQCRRRSDHKRRGPGDSGAGWGFGMSLNMKAGGRLGAGIEESDEIGRQRVIVVFGRAQSFHTRVAVGKPRVERDKLDASVRRGEDTAGGQDVDSNVDNYRARMEEVERPHIHCAAGEVDTAGSARNYTPGVRGRLSRHDDICIMQPGV